MIDAFTKVVLAGACLFTFAWVILAQRRTIKRLSDAYLRLTHFQRVLVALAVIVCTVYAQKPSTNDVEGVAGTNQVEIVEGGGTNEVVAQTYRLESVSTNEGYSYAMPADGMIRGTWHLTGAYEDVQKVALDGFAFPLGSDLCTSLWAYTWGKVRPQLKNASNEIAAVGAPMSAIPDVSRFWSAATTNDTYLLTWENFVAGRTVLSRPSATSGGQWVGSPHSASCGACFARGIRYRACRGGRDGTVNAQIELFRNGDFITRSNDVECVYRRVIEPNPIVYPINPPDPGDPTKPICPYGPVQDLSVIEETNAYCWVDIVVDSADAWVYFEGDGASNLADPSFAAKAGETNHVVILIGKTYKVTCDMPFTLVGKSDPNIDEWWEDGNTLWLNWPVNIWSVGDDEEPPLLLMSFGTGSPRRKGFTMFVSPSGLGGGFIWTNCCCSVSGSGYYFSYNCNADCSCGGCAATGYFSYEGYRLSASGGSCGCGCEDDDDDDDDDDESPPVGIVADFSKKVIFLENEYANTMNEVVPWYSDTSSLCCTAWGGENGGHVSISIVGDSNLIQYGGQTLPIERDLEPYEELVFTNTYKAVAEGSGYEAIVVTATFDENDSDWSETSIAKATAVRVEVEPVVGREGCPNRHLLGVREELHVNVHPSLSATECRIKVSDEWWVLQSVGDKTYFCPLLASSNGLEIEVNHESYTPNLQIVEPQSIVCRTGIIVCGSTSSGTAGQIGMKIDPIIQPETVAFNGVRMMEIPMMVSSTPPSGYFTNEVYSAFWAHTRARGAGVWRTPTQVNLFFVDTASFGEPCPPPWSNGSIDWDVPIGWGDRDAESVVDVVKEVPGPHHQITTIDPQGGVKVEKYEQWVKRMPDGEISHSPGIRNIIESF